MSVGAWVGLGAVALLCALTAYDVFQRGHAILRTFPLVGHLRYILESFGPELRQYIVTGDDDERPFTRNQRDWVYASSKGEDNHVGFGTDNDLERDPGYLIIKHAAFPLPRPAPGEDRVPAAKVMGAARGRRSAFRPASIVNISAMSYGALSGRAIESLNRGALAAGALHNTGEGGISPHHLHGGELVFQVGTGYFGCRDSRGRFDLGRLQDTVASAPVRAVEIKLSQGAKPGIGGMLPGAKVSPAIAAARGVPAGQDCISPSGHSAFGDVDELLDMVEEIAGATGLPVGIKSAVGELGFWRDLTAAMASTSRGVDFVTIDGGEGGTGAAPLVFTDHVALPFLPAMSRVYPLFVDAGLSDDVVFVGSGKLGLPESALLAFALGCDLVNVGREAMLAIGCIQAQRCHTGRCPAGIATQSPWLTRGVDPGLKSARAGRYLINLRTELLTLARACGAEHPALVTTQMFELFSGRFDTESVQLVTGYEDGWGQPSEADIESIVELMRGARLQPM
jgi:glutamate synthase domain-containing protein 2